MAKAYKVIWFGKETSCYGELQDTSNFHVVCENEDDDNVWCDGIEGWELTWDNVVMYLQKYYASDIVEISAV